MTEQERKYITDLAIQKGVEVVKKFRKKRNIPYPSAQNKKPVTSLVEQCWRTFAQYIK